MVGLFRRKTKRQRLEALREKKKEAKAKRFRQSKDRVYWGRLFGYLGRYKLEMVAIGFLILACGALGVALPQVSRIVLDYVIPHKDFTLLNYVAIAGIGAYVLYAVLRYWEQKLVAHFSMNVITDVRTDVFRYQMKLPLSYFEKTGSGKLLSKITYSIYTIRLLIETFAYVCIRELVLIAMIVGTAMWIDYRLTLLFLVAVPFVYLYIRRLNRYMADVSQTLQTKNDMIMKILNRAYGSVKLFKIFGEGENEGDRLEKELVADKEARIQRTVVYALNAIVVTTLTSIIIIIALWYGGRQMIVGRLSYGDVMAFIMCLGMLLRPVSEFIRASAYWQAGKIGVRTIFSVFDHDLPIDDPGRAIKPVRREGRVDFRNVHFNYMKGRGGVKNLSFKIESGQKVLIIGPSGSGKSTIFNLMMRLYEPERGTITIDGVNIRRMKINDLRNYFTVVTQDQLHVEDSILNNIVFGANQQSRQLDKAIQMAAQTDMTRFITGLDKKFGQGVEASGINFSRGELQKIAIMRAAAKDSPIVLMDEPTASLDHHSERKIMELINQQFRNKTILMISHRPVPLFEADWIIVLKHGFMEQQGHHHFLMRESRFYRHLNTSHHHH